MDKVWIISRYDQMIAIAPDEQTAREIIEHEESKNNFKYAGGYAYRAWPICPNGEAWKAAD